jgi:hypothetical protein
VGDFKFSKLKFCFSPIHLNIRYPARSPGAMDLQLLLNWAETSPDVDENSIFSLLDILGGANPLDAPPASVQTIPSALFATIQKWIALHQDKPLRNALVVWTKWFSLPQNLLPSQEILCDPDLKYFDVLQLALQDCIGHPALQKYALYVLRKSMLLLEQDVHSDTFDFEVRDKLSYLAEYNKYCSLFETIVIGRSVNQAEECLHQVPKFEQRSEDDERRPQSNGDLLPEHRELLSCS